jgi:hypothetical protein
VDELKMPFAQVGRAEKVRTVMEAAGCCGTCILEYSAPFPVLCQALAEDEKVTRMAARRQ